MGIRAYVHSTWYQRRLRQNTTLVHGVIAPRTPVAGKAGNFLLCSVAIGNEICYFVYGNVLRSIGHEMLPILGHCELLHSARVAVSIRGLLYLDSATRATSLVAAY